MKAGSASRPSYVEKEKKKLPGWAFSLIIIAIVVLAVVFAWFMIITIET